MATIMAPDIQSFYTPSTPSQMTSHASPTVDGLFSKCSSPMSGSSVVSVNDMPCKRRPNALQRVIDRVGLEYYRYEVTYGVYTMTPGEKIVANTFVTVVLSLLLWTLLFYCPALLYHKLGHLEWLLTGQSGAQIRGAVWNVFDEAQQASSLIPTISSANVSNS